ncbi:MAG: M1 family metallopeptidase [Ferruginibacter sp.]|nr:M1 family metallopeptidase [Ferruginibacter sp.]
MKKLFLLFILSYCQPPASNCQTTYWQQQVNFNIDVTLNDKNHTLDGFVKLTYYNNSPDSLYYIWFHLWPNAFKNDRTAFSDQLLENGRTDFYFSNSEKRGYINRLDFRVNGTVARMEDHPMHQDIIKIVLPQPLAPKSSAKIQTPFHVQLPFNFSRGGHVGQSYQITQWFPKPAVYDRKGWHPIPYLDQGEFYSEFGNYEVQITLPQNYVVASSGVLQDQEEQNWLKKKITTPFICKDCGKAKKQQINKPDIPSSKDAKTIHFKQDNIHDFAWFADKSFIVYHDSLQLSGGRSLNIYSYHLPTTSPQNFWARSSEFIKKSILTRGKWLGEYPYNIVSVVEAEMGFTGGMEYPAITSITPVKNERDLEGLIEHEVGHNWNYGILATNERAHPWMDEGMNTYYDDRYDSEENYTGREATNKPTFFTKRIPEDLIPIAFKSMASGKKDQPIETSSEKFSEINYGLVAYYKTGQWMKLLENELGTAMFDSCMHEYYRRWKFKHPYPEDFKTLLEEVSGKNLDAAFSLLAKKGNLPAAPAKKDFQFRSFFNLRDADKHQYIFAAPAAGYNYYDQLMVGGIIHNYTLPAKKLKFVLVPLYATGSKQLKGIGNINFTMISDNTINKIVTGINAAGFSTRQSLDTLNNKMFENFYKIVPSVQLYFKHPYRSTTVSYIDMRIFLIGEQSFDNNSFVVKAGGDSSVIFPMATAKSNRYISQVSLNVENSRVLYPYRYQLQFQQGKSFYRVNLNGNYFFNYAKKGGMQVRFFAAKFGYLGEKSADAYQYQPKLLAANGDEDYTYNNYFIGRSASSSLPEKPVRNLGIAARQIMIRDGGLKLRLDQFDFLQGRSENWVAALNFSTTLPDLFPVKLPLKFFLDIGTNAEAWKKEAQTTKFLYVGGLQLSLFKNFINIYAPLIYSKDFKNTLKTMPDQNTFFKKLTFSIDIQNIKLQQVLGKIPF